MVLVIGYAHQVRTLIYITWIGDIRRGHSSDQPKGRRNPLNVPPRHVFLTIFLSLY